MVFEWDEEKERDNVKAHGIRFAVAEQVFSIPFAWNAMTTIQARARTDGRQWGFLATFFLWCTRSEGRRRASYRQGLRSLSNGGYIMAIVRRVVGRELDPEKRAAMEAEVREAAKRPYVYDPDCPLLTEEQLAEFRPVNYATDEERLAAMGLQPDERSLVFKYRRLDGQGRHEIRAMLDEKLAAVGQ